MCVYTRVSNKKVSKLFRFDGKTKKWVYDVYHMARIPFTDHY